MMYQVITNLKEISILNEKLEIQVLKKFIYKEKRRITSPAGIFKADVYAEKNEGDDIRIWSSIKKKKKFVNLLLFSAPGTDELINIEVQLNFPKNSYDRQNAGAFIKDNNGDIFIAHRGSLTGPNGALRKKDVFREFSGQCIDASDNGKTSRLILIDDLNNPNLIRRLWSFAKEARRAVTKIYNDSNYKKDSTTSSLNRTNTAPKLQQKNKQLSLKLKDYFDESSGEGNSKGYSGGKRVVEHGDIVKALEKHLNTKGESQKSREIDLAIIHSKSISLFEVKTSAKTTAIYTGTGQLLIHSNGIENLLKIKVEKFLVLPEIPKYNYEKLITMIGIKIVLYSKNNGKYSFTDI